MALNFGSKNQTDEIYDDLKILATSVETLNKQVSGNPQLEQKLDVILANLASMNTKLSNQETLTNKKLAEFMQLYINDKKN